MPNQLDGNGLQVLTLTEITDALKAGLQAIYGTDINLTQNSPDGQMVGIFGQAAADQLNLLLDVYNSFGVEAAYGAVLDQRVALNGLARTPGSYTLAQVLVTVDRALTLTGRDALIANPTAQVYTIADSTGNEYQLVTTKVFSGAGSDTLEFRASVIGRLETLPNTITNQVTTVLGVLSVNNPSVAGDTIGVDEETDAQLKIRHGRMFELASTGPADAIAAALLAAPDVVDAYVVENNTGGIVDTVPAHAIWCIVTGGADADIAQAIYSKKMPGCEMKGGSSAVVTRPAGNSFTAKWDASIAEDLYIEFGLVPRVPGATFDNDLIKTQLAAALSYKLGQSPTVGDVISAMLVIAPNGYLTGTGVGDDGMSYGDVIAPTTAQHYFTVDAANITIT